jgi:hypothetical protein
MVQSSLFRRALRYKGSLPKVVAVRLGCQEADLQFLKTYNFSDVQFRILTDTICNLPAGPKFQLRKLMLDLVRPAADDELNTVVSQEDIYTPIFVAFLVQHIDVNLGQAWLQFATGREKRDSRFDFRKLLKATEETFLTYDADGVSDVEVL